MTSDSAYVWVWLPGANEPVVAGRIDRTGLSHSFTYGQSYLARPDSISLYLPELPLVRGAQRPDPSWEAHGCLQDAGPDYRGRRVLLARHFGHLTMSSDTDDLPFLTYLLESGSDRIGALDFQLSATEYRPRTFGHHVDLAELLSAADRIEAGQTLTPALEDAIFRGTSIGGARPKALINGPDDQRFIAKFSSTTDPYPVIKAEAVAMKLAETVGLSVAPSRLEQVNGRDVLLIERFDRGGGGERRMVVSALTILGEMPMTGHYASYPRLADEVRTRFSHARAEKSPTHWPSAVTGTNGLGYRCANPQPKPISSASGRQAGRQAAEIIDHMVAVVEDNWAATADAAGLNEIDRSRLLGGAILNPSIFHRD